MEPLEDLVIRRGCGCGVVLAPSDPMSQAGSWGRCRGMVTTSLPLPSSPKAGSVVLSLLLPWAKLILKVFQN